MERKFEQAANWGFDAIEVRGDALREEHRAIAQQVRQGAGRVAGIVGGYRGWPIAADPDERLQCLEDIARLLTYAAEVEATGVIIVPIYGYSARLPYPQQRDAVADEERLSEALHELTEFAESVGSTAAPRTAQPLRDAPHPSPRPGRSNGASGSAASGCDCSPTSST